MDETDPIPTLLWSSSWMGESRLIEPLANRLMAEKLSYSAAESRMAASSILCVLQTYAFAKASIRKKSRPSTRTINRELSKLLRNGRLNSVKELLPETQHVLTRALCEIGTWSKDWKERAPAQLAAAAERALQRKHRGKGRPENIPLQSLCMGFCEAAKVLGITPSSAPRTKFRRLLSVGIEEVEKSLGISFGLSMLSDWGERGNPTLAKGIMLYKTDQGGAHHPGPSIIIGRVVRPSDP